MFARRIAIPLALAVIALGPPAAAGETTVPITGIGTQIDWTGTLISTHADSVTYSDPVLVEAPGSDERVFEIRGVCRGVGWGGSGIVARASLAHYAYEVPFVARWPRCGGGKTLVTFHHGGPPPLLASTLRDKLEGAQNPSRLGERLGDLVAGFPALVNDCTYIAWGRRGLLPDGSYGAKYLPGAPPLVPPLTAAEAASLQATIAAAPGTAGYVRPEIAAGAPVPLTLPLDTWTVRDVDRALERAVACASGTRRFRERIAIGQSAGSVVLGGMAFGRRPIGAQSVPTGGNFWIAGDAGSAPIFDGYILNGYPYEVNIPPSVPRADPVHPISVPVMFVTGRADERYQQPIAMADELLANGVELNGAVWLYEVKNLTHVSRESILEVFPPNVNGERLGAYLSAGIRNMRDLVRHGVEPPRSRIAGRLDASGALVFDVAGGGTTNVAPIREDPAIDTVPPDPMIIPRTVGPLDTERWKRVTAVLDHHEDAIAGPTVACRVGGYQLRFFGAGLTPFDPATLTGMYGSFKGYRRAVKDVVADLKAERLYDPRIESAKETAELARDFFEEAP